MTSLVGAGLCALVALILLKELRKELAPLFLMGFTVILLGALLSRLGEAFAFVKECTEGAGGERLAVVLKALGITYLSSLGAELCRSAGEGGLAGLMELAGKAELLLLCIPLFRSVLEMALSLS